MSLSDIITIIALAIGSGGLVTAYIALRKFPLEQKAVAVDILKTEADVKAVDAQIQQLAQESLKEVIEELREHITDLSERLDRQKEDFALQFRSQQTIIDDLKTRLWQTEQRLHDAEATNKQLTHRVEVLEAENNKLRQERDRLLGSDTQ